jgi:hypothetical protein
MMRRLFCILILCTLSCGKNEFPDYEDNSAFEQEEQEEVFFRGTFETINSQKAKKISGLYVLWIEDVQFYVKVMVSNAPSKVRYQQYIHSGERCPVRSDDLNGDGIIDFSEVLQSSGKILVPLDGVLRTQTDGIDWFPLTNAGGKYSYSRAGAIFHMMEDLRSKDPLLRPDMTKLTSSENLDLNRRTIILYGSASDPLLPVACAEIGR